MAGYFRYNGGEGRIFVTVVILGVVIGVILFAYTSFASASASASRQNPDKTLQQVIILFRHGDRTPTETYPKDPYINYPWEDGWGALRKKGMRRMYKLGQWLRKEYGYLNDHKYMANGTYVSSSYSDRCIMSSQALLAGLYPPNREDSFTEDLLWRPIPVHYAPRERDKVITVNFPCPRLSRELKLAYEAEESARDERLRSYYKEVSEHAGRVIKTNTDMEFLYNTLEIEVQEGLELPDWAKRYYKEMLRIARESYAIFTSNALQKRLRGGPLLKRILGEMDDIKRGSKSARKMQLYGVHDITLVNLMRTMGISEYNDELLKPGLGANLIFELWKNHKDEDYVKVKYMDDSKLERSEDLSIPNCAINCPLEQMMTEWKRVIPENWDDECEL